MGNLCLFIVHIYHWYCPCYHPFSIHDFETVNMTVHQHFDIRTVTLGINLKDCMDRILSQFCKRTHKRIVTKGKLLNKYADEIELKYGIPITNRRIAVTPVSILLEPLPRTVAAAVKVAKTLDDAATQAGIDFLGGYGALVQKGMTSSDKNLMEELHKILTMNA